MNLAFLRRLDRSATPRITGFHTLTRAARRVVGTLLGDRTVRFDGLRMCGAVRHRSHLLRVGRGAFEPFTTGYVKSLVKPGMVVLDIGAYLGYYTLLAARAGARVYAFEPDPVTFSYLTRNARDNGVADRVTLLPLAVASRAGRAPFHLAELPESNSLFASSSSLRTIEVECVSLDDILDPGLTVDFIKIDVEGAELDVLQGMTRLLDRTRHRLVMVVECNARRQRAAGRSVRELIERLRDLGFAVMMRDRRRGRWTLPDIARVEAAHSVNLFCTRGGQAPGSETA
jgi:FkbM family methyltransferase